MKEHLPVACPLGKAQGRVESFAASGLIDLADQRPGAAGRARVLTSTGCVECSAEESARLN
eukprot:4575045-Pyramimonas_sp.AAC.1